MIEFSRKYFSRKWIRGTDFRGNDLFMISSVHFSKFRLYIICYLIVGAYSKLSKLNENNQGIYQDYIKIINEGISNKTLKNSRFKLRSKYYQSSLNSLVKIKNFSQLFEFRLTFESIEVLTNVETKSKLNQSLITIMVKIFITF